MRTCLTITLLSTIFICNSCATIISGTNYPLHIRTDPAGARVSVTNKKGKTIFEGNYPANIKVKSGAGYFTKAKCYIKLP